MTKKAVDSLTIKPDSLVTANGLVIAQTSGLGNFGAKISSNYGAVPILVGADGSTSKFIFTNNGGGLTLGNVWGTGLYPIYVNSLWQGGAEILHSTGEITAAGYMQGTYGSFSGTYTDSGTVTKNIFSATFNPSYNLSNSLRAATFAATYSSTTDSSTNLTAGHFETTVNGNQYIGQIMAGNFIINYNNTFAGNGGSVYSIKSGLQFSSNSGSIVHAIGHKIETPIYDGTIRPDGLWGLYIANQNGSTDLTNSAGIHFEGSGTRNGISFGFNASATTSQIYSDSVYGARHIVLDADNVAVTETLTVAALVQTKLNSGFIPFHSLQTLASNWTKSVLISIVSLTTGNIHFWLPDEISAIKAHGLFSTITLDSIHFLGIGKSTSDSITFSMRMYTPESYKQTGTTYATTAFSTLVMPTSKDWIKFTVGKNVASFNGDSTAVYNVTSKIIAADTCMLQGYKAFYTIAP